MIVTLKQHEIEVAIKKHLSSMLGVAQGVDYTIQFAATRGEAGLTATVDLEAREETPAPVAVVKTMVQNHAPALAAVSQDAQATPVHAPAVAASSPSPLAAVFAADVAENVVAAAQPEAAPAAANEAPAVPAGKSLFG